MSTALSASELKDMVVSDAIHATANGEAPAVFMYCLMKSSAKARMSPDCPAPPEAIRSLMGESLSGVIR